jgi:hypothetical protein
MRDGREPSPITATFTTGDVSDELDSKAARSQIFRTPLAYSVESSLVQSQNRAPEYYLIGGDSRASK